MHRLTLGFETSKPVSIKYLLQQGHTSLIHPNTRKASPGDLMIKHLNLWGTFLIQTTTDTQLQSWDSFEDIQVNTPSHLVCGNKFASSRKIRDEGRSGA